MPRYRVGDFVELVVDAPDGNRKLSPGDIGQIVKISGGNLGVDWGKNVGHNVDVLWGERRHYGWWVKKDDVVVRHDVDIDVQLDTDMLDSLLSGRDF